MGTPVSTRNPLVYVSFSGVDSRFAEALISRLRIVGRYDVSFDPDLTVDEDQWKRVVDDLIAECDTVVMVLSPEALQTCQWELDCALRHAKRILPVVCRPLTDGLVPAALARLDLIECKEGGSLARLLVALGADIDWLREHTRLLDRARAWDTAGRPNHLLLSPEEIDAAKAWTLNRPKDTTKPSELQLNFISTSEAVRLAQTGAIRAYHAEMDEAAAVDQLQRGGSLMRRWRWQAAMAAVLAIAALFAWSARPLSTEIQALAGASKDASATGSSLKQWEQNVSTRDEDRDQR